MRPHSPFALPSLPPSRPNLPGLLHPSHTVFIPSLNALAGPWPSGTAPPHQQRRVPISFQGMFTSGLLFGLLPCRPAMRRRGRPHAPAACGSLPLVFFKARSDDSIQTARGVPVGRGRVFMSSVQPTPFGGWAASETDHRPTVPLASMFANGL